MTFNEIDTLVGTLMKNKFSDTERRDYWKLEKQNPGSFLGYGDKSGLMFLASDGYDHYIDVNITKKEVKLSLREDDDVISVSRFKIELFNKDHLLYFFHLIDEYFKVMGSISDKFNDFENGIFSKDWIRDNKIDTIVS